MQSGVSEFGTSTADYTFYEFAYFKSLVGVCLIIIEIVRKYKVKHKKKEKVLRGC